MSIWNGYVGAEDLGMTAPQRAAIVGLLQQLGANQDAQPVNRNHWRVRLDGLAVIFHAQFDTSGIDGPGIQAKLASTFGVALGSITYTTGSVTFASRASPVLTYSYQAATKLRCTAFGGYGASWAESRAEVLAYLAANRVAWEPAGV